jgi:N-methylhydantoinase A
MVHCAYGALSSDVVHSAQAALPGGTVPTDGEASATTLDDARLTAAFATLEREAVAVVAASGVPPDAITVRRSADLRYRAQTNELIIEHDGTLAQLVARFEQTYEDFYGAGAGYREAGIEITTVRVQAIGATETPRQTGTPSSSNHDASAATAPAAEREITDPATGEPCRAAVRAWSSLLPGQPLSGPAIVEHPTTTVYVAPGQRVVIDTLGNLQLMLTP